MPNTYAQTQNEYTHNRTITQTHKHTDGLTHKRRIIMKPTHIHNNDTQTYTVRQRRTDGPALFHTHMDTNKRTRTYKHKNAHIVSKIHKQTNTQKPIITTHKKKQTMPKTTHNEKHTLTRIL